MPISAAAYRQHNENYWKGRNVRLLYSVATNAGVTYPAGSIATITRKRGGFDLLGEPCACCGVTLRIKQMPWANLELIESEERDVTE